ncbi:Crp/Fnr family transcriptional regulator [Mucilaginibacter psychrotolerans]|uniref:Crp/Fnr family transcriptional regulator n=1 Tax=Mucilaginibacter psychrotolerans TaxID=1524096 RepID=A0A4Y8S7N4_9SPHI|nr:Crp/Fnr family transcriptional regulator [Mucilaginibacter psychrotolerans]TFF34595.1 Crp/Fnr family transcriptional regulator [Mucilaginibacter psychrotolerans]
MSLNGIFPIDRWNFTTHSVLSVLSEEETARLTRHLTEQHLFKGDVIFREGTVPSGIFLVRSGRVKKYKVDQLGKEQIIYVAGPGELMGYHPVLSGERYADSATAMEDTMVSFIPKEDFMDVLSRSSVFALRMLKAMSHEFTVLTNSISVIAQRTGPERLAIALIVLREKFKYGLSDNEAIPINISRTDLANMAGLAAENVIRLLGEFKAEGILLTEGRKIIIRDVHLLVKRANYR